MLVSVTALGSVKRDGARGAAMAIVDYLEGRRLRRSPELRRTGPTDVTTRDGVDPVVGYYADSVEGPGTWLGRGIDGVVMRGDLEREEFRRLLLGRDPRTDLPLVTRLPEPVTADGSEPHDGEWLGLDEAAKVAGVSASYLRRLCRHSEQATVQRVCEVVAGTPLTKQPRRFLLSERAENGSWLVERASVQKLAERRAHRAVVLAYDLTFSAPKSVSILWATGDRRARTEILASVDAAVAVGVTYLEDHALFVRVKGRRRRASGLLAGSYLHATSRALDPQLHRHVVIANMAAAAGGPVRALDGTPLWAHAKTAGYLAAAELRHQLSTRLGVAWGPVANGLADIDGVPEQAIRAMSTRSAEISRAAGPLGASASSRQIAAYDTRANKDTPVDPTELRRGWHERLDAAGFGPQQLRRCLDRHTPSPPTAHEVSELYRQLASADGLTDQSATFDRRHVLQYIAEWAGDRLPAAAICDLADRWLASELCVWLDPARRAPDVSRGAGAAEALYSTPEMLAVERWILDCVPTGFDTDTALVPVDIVSQIVETRSTLGADQANVVRAITMSGDQTQCVVGPAGTGKTFTLEVAARAWEAAGHRVVGAAVGGTAAEVLGQATGVPTMTVASLLAGLDHRPWLDATTVVVVDEASTLSNRDLGRLLAHTRAAGAALRLVGDPAQHSAVNAGGAWRYLVDNYPQRTPQLTTIRRQQGAAMEPVRLAVAEYRDGRIADALARLERDERIVQAATGDELLDCVVVDWYIDRQQRLRQGGPRSSMTAEHHPERRELNRRARALLAADGTLRGPEIEAAGVSFRAGDEVIARSQDRTLHPPDDRAAFVRNGTRGTVVAVHCDSLVVDFDRRGPIELPRRFLEQQLRPGIVGGLVHSYCVTSYAAQGDTYATARHLSTDRSTRAGVYVGLTRGQSDTRLYTVRHRALEPELVDDTLPRLNDRVPTIDAVIRRLQQSGPERLAYEHDSAALDAHTVVESGRATAPTETVLDAATRLESHRRRAAAPFTPPAEIVEHLGPRPDGGPPQRAWDHAVAEAARYHQTWNQSPLQPAASDNEDMVADRAIVAAACHTARVAIHAERPTRQLATQIATARGPDARVMRDALDRQVDRAVRYPAPYLIAALGPRPTVDDSDIDRWRTQAARVEHWRHYTLGLSPSDGPVAPGTPLIAALGPEPDEPEQSRQWRRLRRSVRAVANRPSLTR